MKQKPSDAAIEGVVTIARNGIARINELKREVQHLRALSDDMFASLVAALSLAPHDSTVRSMLETEIDKLRPRWLRKEKP